MFRPFTRLTGGLFPSGTPEIRETADTLTIVGAPPRDPVPKVWSLLRSLAALAAIIVLIIAPGDISAKAVGFGAAVVLAGALQGTLDKLGKRTIVLSSGIPSLTLDGLRVALADISGARLCHDGRSDFTLCLQLPDQCLPLIRGEREALLSVWDDIARACAVWSRDGKGPPLSTVTRRFPHLAPPEAG